MWLGRELWATAGPRPVLGRGERVTLPLLARGARLMLPLLARGVRLIWAL